jgi:hypothetical protein
MYFPFLSILFIADHMPQVDRFLKGPFTDRQGNLNYREWVKVLRINAENEEGEAQAQT